jgi:hypothetical protein
MDPFEPLRVALAWLVTAGDDEFVELIRGDFWWRKPETREYRKALNKPHVLAGILAGQMEKAGVIKEVPSRREKLAQFADDYCGRLQQLGADWNRSEPERNDPVFGFMKLVAFLESRIANAWEEIRPHIANSQIRARGVPVDAHGSEGHSRDILPSEITETMCLESDGLLYQSPGERGPAWKSVSVSWGDFIKSFSSRMPASAVSRGEDSDSSEDVAAAPGGQRKKKSSPQLELAGCILDELYPNGVPDQRTLRNNKLCKEVSELQKRRGLREVSDETILRAAKRRK